jgi:hypothetical protein
MKTCLYPTWTAESLHPGPLTSREGGPPCKRPSRTIRDLWRLQARDLSTSFKKTLHVTVMSYHRSIIADYNGRNLTIALTVLSTPRLKSKFQTMKLKRRGSELLQKKVTRYMDHLRNGQSQVLPLLTWLRKLTTSRSQDSRSSHGSDLYVRRNQQGRMVVFDRTNSFRLPAAASLTDIVTKKWHGQRSETRLRKPQISMPCITRKEEKNTKKSHL